MSDVFERSTITRDEARQFLTQMLRVRMFEDRCAELYTKEKIRGFLHLYDGEEAIAVGAISGLRPTDRIVATYREHGHALVRGVAMDTVMAEMMGKAYGCSGGRGGSMHLFDSAANFYGGNAIVGGGLPLAVGLALADTMMGNDAITVCFFGEGAVAEGEFHESLNLAALWSLPVLFVCENNRYAMGTSLERSESVTDIHAKAESYGIASRVVDGMDVVAVSRAALAAVSDIRDRKNPVFLECRTYRFRAHSMFDAQLYRDKAEVEAWRAKGPIVRFRAFAKEEGLIAEDEVFAIETAIAREIDDAVAFADAAPREPLETLTKHLLAPARPVPPGEKTGEAQTISYREAVREAIRTAMLEDDRVFLMGEDVGKYGGCYAVSKGLLDEFGPERVRDTPLSESGFTGAGIGAAAAGMRPIVELMTVNFSLLALDQILNTAATLRHMSGGEFGVPLVIRMATGAGRQLAAQHSHSLEGWYAHIPGLRILAPGTVEDAHGMLLAALREPDPVLIFENVMLYNSVGPMRPGAVEIDNAAVRREGTDISLITYGGSLHKTLKAAEILAEERISGEVIDLRVLRPLDEARILDSLERTRRAVIIDEGWRSGSLAAEVSARIMERGFWSLDAPVERVCSAEIPIPYPKHLEDASLPQPDTIAAAARKVLGRG